MVNWPGIIKHYGDDELIYVHDEAAWRNDASLHANAYDASDYLVDVCGNIHRLTTTEEGIVQPLPDGTVMSLNEVLGLVKAHAATTGSCCVAKLYAPSIGEALRIVRSLQQA